MEAAGYAVSLPLPAGTCGRIHIVITDIGVVYDGAYEGAFLEWLLAAGRPEDLDRVYRSDAGGGGARLCAYRRG
ncbi:hypothetical protein D3C78_1934510 [compost metagenome]